jgi:hypothetical protein
MLGVLGNAKRKLDRIEKNIRHWVKSGQNKNHEEWHQGFPSDDNGCLDYVN